MIKEILPFNLLQDDTVEKIADAVNEKLKEILSEIPLVLIYPQIDNLPENIIDLLAWQFHVEGYELATDIEQKRKLVKNAIELHRYKGTRWAIKKVLENINITADIIEWFENGGSGEPYTFNIKLSFEKDIESLNYLVSLISEYKNVRSQPQIDYELTRKVDFEPLALNNLDVFIDKGLKIGTASLTIFQSEEIFGFEIDSKLFIDSKVNVVFRERSIVSADFWQDLYLPLNAPQNIKSNAILNMEIGG